MGIPNQNLRLSIAAICEAAIESRGRWTLVNMSRVIESPGVPGVVARLEIYLLFTGRIDKAQRNDARILLFEPSHAFGEPVLEMNMPLSPAAAPNAWECAFRSDNLALFEAGEYNLVVEVDGDVYDLIVVHVKDLK